MQINITMNKTLRQKWMNFIALFIYMSVLVASIELKVEDFDKLNCPLLLPNIPTLHRCEY